MSILITSGQSAHSRGILGHWLWAVPVLLIVAALTFRQIDMYPPTPDEFYSMYNTGWLVNGPYSPIDVMQSLQRYSPNHTPGYFILLSIWGNLTAYDLALGRVLTIFTGLLSLAIAYRLARDFVAPVAGLFALIIVASNAFYNFYYAHVRMYPLLVLTSGIALWLYLRIIYQQKRVKRRDYLALGAAVFALVNAHAFSAGFLIMLGIWHLIAVPKNRRWLWVSLAVAIAVLLLSPWMPTLIFAGIDRIAPSPNDPPVGSLAAIQVWLTLFSNSQPFLLLLSIAGLALGIWKQKAALKPYLMMPVIFLLVLALAAQFSDLIQARNMRYQLAGWLLFALFIAAGFYALYRFRRWLGLLSILFWVIAGLAFQTTVAGRQYLGDRISTFSLPPAQAISRLALQAEQKPVIVNYNYSMHRVSWPSYTGYSQREHYFERHNIAFEGGDNPEWLENDVRSAAITEPSIWIVYQTSTTHPEQAAEINVIMDDLNYQRCEAVEIGIDTVIAQYLWKSLNCQPPQLLSSHQTDAIDYQFYDAALDIAHSKLLFSDQWTAQGDDDLENYKMSYQLISADWSNPAQLDLPLVRPGELRQFSIDISKVAPGQYRLMAILYNKHTGERQNWLNSAGDLPTMLTLTDIIIP